MSRLFSSLTAGVAAATLSVVIAGCSSTGGSTGTSSAGGPIAIKAGDHRCDVAARNLPAGRHTFEVTNTASQVTEVYVYAAGDRIMGEVENIGPATKRTLIVDLPGGAYQVACKPGMVGLGIRSQLIVTGVTGATATAPSGAHSPDRQQLAAATQLVITLDRRFAALISLLETHRSGRTYVSYDRLSKADVRALAVEVDSLSEPLGMLSGVVTGP